MTKLRVCNVGDLEDNTVMQFIPPNGKEIAIYRLDGEFFATEDLCSHGQAFLSEGDIEDGNVVCPFHGGTFDIRTGDATAAPCIVPVKTYPVNRDGDDVYVEIDSPD